MSSCLHPCRVRVIFRTSTSRFSYRTRSFSSTCCVRKEEPPEEEVNEGGPSVLDVVAAEVRPDEEAFGDETYSDWLLSEGSKWKDPDPLGPKWLGGSVPFPLNPTFKPPTPISDALRTTIYTSYVTAPTENDFHTLSTRYGIAVKRIEAIIRLKDLERQWMKFKPLQTGFLQGMERLLGLNPGGRSTSIRDEIDSHDRAKVNAADEVSRQATEEGRDRKRGISRTFFEPVDEGQEPIIPHLLDEVRDKAHVSRAQQPEYPTKFVHPDPLRPAYKFVDVGLRWVDRTDIERRDKESKRRKKIKERKGTLNQLAEDG